MLIILNKEIEQQTAFSQQKRKSLINWFNKQNIEIQVKVFGEQRNQFFKIKVKDKASQTLALSAFFIAINTFYQKEQVHNKKNKSIDLNSLSTISDFNIKKFRKDRFKEKREKLLNIWSVVKKLKNEGFSYRQISQYITSKHRFVVSHTYISKMWNEIEND